MATTKSKRSTTSQSRSGSSNGTRSRARSRQSHSLAAEANRHILRPVSDAVSSATRTISRAELPSWLPYVLGGVGLGALIYGLFQITAVSGFMAPVTDGISDVFSSEEETEDLGSELSKGVGAPNSSF